MRSGIKLDWQTGDTVLIGNAENSLKECKQEKDALEIFKKDLGTYVRFYEFMSQIVDYDDKEVEKLSLYARHLRPMLREKVDKEGQGEYGLEPGNEMGSAKARDKKEEFLSTILQRLNELFITNNLTDDDMLNYARTVADKVGENERVMHQLKNNTPDQAFLGDFPQAVDDAVMSSSEAHQNQMLQILSNPQVAQGFGRVVFDIPLKKENHEYQLIMVKT